MEDASELLNVWMETVRDYAIFLVDLSGRVASWNVGAERILGYTESEVFGLPLSILFTQEDRNQGIPEWELETARNHGRATDDRWHVRKDGTRFWCNGLLTAIRDGDGSIRSYVKVMRDLTERKLMEDELRARAEALLEADRRKNEFLAMLSHELRNPMAPILTSLFVLKAQDRIEDSVQEQARAMIERQVMNLKRLVEDLLDVSRLALNRIQLKSEPLDLATVAARAVENLRPLIRERHHKLTVTTEPGSLWLRADPIRLEQVIENLLANAARFTDPGGTIWLTVEREVDQAVLRVRDTGIGIAAEMLDRAFVLFTQADQGLARSRGGLGIGLNLARNLVTLHGGTIEARSEGVGKGSEFIVRLPLPADQPQAPESQPFSTPANSPLVTTTKGTGRRILIVDDNIDAARSIELLLEHAGFEVQLAHDGRSALDMVRSFQPAVVLLDIGLPHLDGYTVAREARRGNPVLLIGLSGYAPDPGARPLFDHYFIKPVRADELLELLSGLEPSRHPSTRSSASMPDGEAASLNSAEK
jgi:PAS domain S-box-containing protein